MISWNSYINFPGSTSGYEIYRTFNIGEPNRWQFISSVPKGVTQYLDTDSLEDTGNEGTCYYIKALEGDSGSYYFNSFSLSNIACYYEDALVKIPDAFLFNGLTE